MKTTENLRLWAKDGPQWTLPLVFGFVIALSALADSLNEQHAFWELVLFSFGIWLIATIACYLFGIVAYSTIWIMEQLGFAFKKSRKRPASVFEANPLHIKIGSDSEIINKASPWRR